MKKTRLLLLGCTLLLGACNGPEPVQSRYCANFHQLLSADSINRPIMRPDFHMNMDSLAKYVQSQVQEANCGGTWIDVPLETGDTLPLHVYFPYCEENLIGCIMQRPRFSVLINQHYQVLVNGKLVSLQHMARDVAKDQSFEIKYTGEWTDVYYHPSIASDSVYHLLSQIVDLHHRFYETRSHQIYKKPFCELEDKHVRALQQTEGMHVYLKDLQNRIPPPPPPPDSSLVE